MRVIIAAEDDGKSVLSATLTFPDREEALGLVYMLEAFARNRWQSSRDERMRKDPSGTKGLDGSEPVTP